MYRSSDSKLIGTYEYDLWGRPISVKEASAGIDTDGILQKNPIRYRSYYYDNETGFYNLNLRYYDPEIRRFISADSMDVLMVATTSINCKNLFNYCENNPVNGKDSSGAVIETPLDLVTLGISIVDVCKNPTDPWAWAGLVGDAIDLIPCVSFVGEAVKGARCAAKYGDDVGGVVVDGIRAIGKKLDDAVRSSKGSNFSRGKLSDYLGKSVKEQIGKFYSISNKSGGQVFVSTENIVQSDIAQIVAMTDGNINIISGRHGDWMDNVILESGFFVEDVERFKNMSNVNVINFAEIDSNGIMQLINSEDTTILGWCYREYSSFMREVFE